MTDFGKRLKELRLSRDLTMDMLVEDMKQQFPEMTIDKSLLSRWENGQNEPTVEKAKYISMYFNVSLDYLIGLTDVKTPSRLLTKKITHI